jgi:hypothetical protein
MSTPLTFLSALFALAAAVLWFLSATVETPPRFAIHTVTLQEGVGHGWSEDLVALANALKDQSKFSSWAARCAAVSAYLVYVSTVWVFVASCPSVRG